MNFWQLAGAVGGSVVLLSACQGAKTSGSSGHSVTVDERRGELLGVGFGDTARSVRFRHGQPEGGDGFLPTSAGSYTGPQTIPSPDGLEPVLLRYRDVAYLVGQARGVYAMTTVASGARTRAGVGVGDGLERVRERYEKVACGVAVAGESLFGGEVQRYSWCRATVAATQVFFGGDPIASVTLTRLPSEESAAGQDTEDACLRAWNDPANGSSRDFVAATDEWWRVAVSRTAVDPPCRGQPAAAARTSSSRRNQWISFSAAWE